MGAKGWGLQGTGTPLEANTTVSHTRHRNPLVSVPGVDFGMGTKCGRSNTSLTLCPYNYYSAQPILPDPVQPNL